MKKQGILLLCCFIVFSVLMSGCGSSTISSSSSSAAATDSSTKPAEKVHITYEITHTPSLFNEFKADFEKKNPNIIVDITYMDDNNNNQAAKLAAGTAPDIIGVDANKIKGGYALDLTDQPFIDRLTDSSKLGVSGADGKIYKVPFDTWFQGIMYNKKIFADNKIEVPETWAEFIAVCDKLKAAGIKPISAGNKAGDVLGKEALGVILSTGAVIEPDIESGKTTYSEKWKAGLTEWYKIVSAGYEGPDSFGMTVDDMINEFLTGKAAMMDMGNWQVADMHKKAPDLDFDTMPYPSVEAGQDRWIIGGSGGGVGVYSQSKHQKEALAFIDYVLTPEGNALYIKASQGGPSVKGVDFEIDPAMSGCVEAINAGRVYAPWESLKKIGGGAFIRTWFKTHQELIAGSKTVDEALKVMDEYVASQLNQ